MAGYWLEARAGHVSVSTGYVHGHGCLLSAFTRSSYHLQIAPPLSATTKAIDCSVTLFFSSEAALYYTGASSVWWLFMHCPCVGGKLQWCNFSKNPGDFLVYRQLWWCLTLLYITVVNSLIHHPGLGLNSFVSLSRWINVLPKKSILTHVL